MRFALTFLLVCFLSKLIAQDCVIKLQIQVLDPHESHSLEFASVIIDEINLHQYTNEDGKIQVDNLCNGDYHILIQHAFCDPKSIFVNLTRDSSIVVYLEHHSHDLQEVEITDSKSIKFSQTQNSIKESVIIEQSGSNLAQLLTSISGVSAIKNGNSIAKPIIHGMSGNRVTILNNGAVQAGQQWGLDHAPEISNLAYEKVSVIKGTDLVAYGGNGVGALVLLEPSAIANDPHWHGFNLVGYESNGHQLMIHSRFEKAGKKLKYKMNVGGKLAGDRSTPDYFLSNTGNRETNASIFITKEENSKLQKLYTSYYFTQSGILKGSHVGNLTDLKDAFTRDIPLYTESSFSYKIREPYQSVHHILSKYSLNFEKDRQFFEINFSGQLNHRSEFDIRRRSQSGMPALALLMQSYQAELKSKLELNKFFIQYGLQSRLNYNYNIPGTGVYPLIPDYLSFNPGVFIQSACKGNKLNMDAGARIDYINNHVKYFDRSSLDSIINDNYDFINTSFSSGISFQINSLHLLKTNIGYIKRSPEVNELFSNGLHQSVSGIEEGNRNLNPEHSFKGILTYQLNTEHIQLEWTNYYHRIRNYIFIQPSNELRLTIRGAFPVFKYHQTLAEILGSEINSRFEINHHWSIPLMFSIIHARDLNQKLPLINIPPTQSQIGLQYSIPKMNSVRSIIFQLLMSYNNKSNVLSNQDFLEVPEEYYLFHLKSSFNFKLGKTPCNFNFQVNNLLNSRYRDYLNRLRYFSDAEGINGSIILKLNF